MTTNYAPNATGLIANQQYRGATWGPNVTSVPIAANHTYNVNPQIRYASFTGLPAFPTAYAATHQVQRVNSATSPANTSSSSSSQGGTMSNSFSTNANSSSSCGGSANSNSSTNSATGNNTTNNTTNGGCPTNKSGGSENNELSKTNLYIRGLSQSTTDKDLINMCSQYGTIMSTKAIMDKNTNKCRGYGFVDFENDVSAENAVKGLQAKGIQAQMAKIGVSTIMRRSASSHQEQDPTNLYFANLPLDFKEHDLETLLSKYGNVVSTRVLRDEVNISKGVGFARMDAKDKCEKIIQALNGTRINGAKEPLLIKFADGGQKKRLHKSDAGHAYDPNGFQQNGIATPILPASALAPYARHFNASQSIGGYSVQASPWVPHFVVQSAPPMTQMDVVPQANAVTYNSMIPQLTSHAHVSPTVHLGTPASYIAASPHPTTYPYCAATPSIIHTVPVAASDEHPPTAVSPDDYQQYPLKWWYTDARYYNGIPMDFIN